MSNDEADDGHALQHLARRRRDAADHVGVERLHPSRLVGGAARELVHRERDAAAERRDLLDELGGGLGDMATDERRDVVVAERTELELGGSMPVDQALARLGECVAHGSRAVGEHDAHALVARRPGDVVHEAQAGVIGVVHVVDGEQQTVRRRCQAHQLGRGDEQPLVRASAAPRDLGPGEGTVDLLSVMIGKTVEQRRMTPAHVGERLDDRRVRPRALDRRRRAVADTEAQLLRPRGDGGEQRRLAHPGRTADDQGAAAAGRGVEEGLLGGRQLGHADQHVVVARGMTSCSASRRSRSANASRPGATPNSRRNVRSMRSNWRSAAWRSPFAAWRRMSARWASSSLASSSITVSQRPSRRRRSRWRSRSCSRRSSAHSSYRSSGSSSPPYSASAAPRHVVAGERPAGEVLEPHDVDGRVGVGAEHDVVAAQHDRVRHVDGAPGEVRRLVQLRRGLVDRVVGPHEIDDLLAVQTPAGRQREHLHERGGVATRPVALGDRHRPSTVTANRPSSVMWIVGIARAPLVARSPVIAREQIHDDEAKRRSSRHGAGGGVGRHFWWMVGRPPSSRPSSPPAGGPRPETREGAEEGHRPYGPLMNLPTLNDAPRHPRTSPPGAATGGLYDVIVVGARAAGAATAMLLARGGLRTLLLDRSAFGSDTLSTHALMRGGVLQLSRWGLLDEIVAAGTAGEADDVPLRRRARRHHHQTLARSRRALCPAPHTPRPSARARRGDAGVDVHHRTSVTDLIVRDGRVVGVHAAPPDQRARRSPRSAGDRCRRHPLDRRPPRSGRAVLRWATRSRDDLRVLVRSRHRRLRVELPSERVLRRHPHQRRPGVRVRQRVARAHRSRRRRVHQRHRRGGFTRARGTPAPGVSTAGHPDVARPPRLPPPRPRARVGARR